MSNPFIHLQIHTEYSLRDSIIKVPALLAAVKQAGMPAVAITDLSNLYAMVKFYSAALKAGVKPIIGSDLILKNQANKASRLLLLCQNQIGYKRLTEIISRSYLEGQQKGIAYVKQQWLEKHTDGLLALIPVADNELKQLLLSNQEQEARQLVQQWQQWFPNRLYLTIQRIGREHEELLIKKVVALAEQLQVPLLATNDVRFIHRSDYDAHEARVCIHQGRLLNDPQRKSIYTPQQYLRNTEEMMELFADIPQAVANSYEIAKRCSLSLKLGEVYLPNFPVPAEQTIEGYLVEQANLGLKKRLEVLFANDRQALVYQEEEYQQRLDMELDVVNSMGFAGYFLIVADFIYWAKQNKIPVGPGRGSGAGSLVAYALQITDLDPISYDLLFERFLNPERVSMPDFDIDFCMEGRDRVIEYVAKRYGKQSVSQIITFGTMAAKAVVRDVGRVLGHPYGFVDQIAKLIPFEVGITLEKALQQEEVLRERYEQEEEIKHLVDLAMKLEGLARNVGKHAGGVVIAPSLLTDFTPLYCEEDGSNLVTQFDKDDVESIGLVKFDFLGLRTLTIIDWALRTVNKQRAINVEQPLDINDIALDDEKTFTLLKSCLTTAVFQLESRGMKDLIKRLQPDCFDDIVALVALFRPGPLQSGMVDDFIDRKHGRAKVTYPHPALEPILKPTYGVILYQEQVMQIAQDLAGYTLGGADLLRRAMGKKKADEMATQRAIFIKGATERKVKPDVANYIFDLMEKFAGYGFNKSHSAAYALLAYQTAWLKAHYAAAFMAAVLSSDMDNTDKVVALLEDCRRLGLTIIPPHINHSRYKFTVNKDNDGIIYGLGAIKGVGEGAVFSLIDEHKQHGDYKDLFEFCRRIDLKKCNRRTLDALIKTGAMDNLGTHRASLLATLDNALRDAEQRERDISSGQHGLFDSMDEEQQITPSYLDVKEWDEAERLAGEKSTLGFYITGHPIKQYLPELTHITSSTLEKFKPQQNQTVYLAGMIVSMRVMFTKKGDRMAFIELDDSSGRVEITVFSECFQKYRDLIQKDQLIIVEVQTSHDKKSGNMRLLAESVFTLDQARQKFAKYLMLHLNPQQFANGLSTDLAETLKRFNAGQVPVQLEYERAGATLNMPLGKKWLITPSDELLGELRGLLKDDNAVKLVYGK